MQSKFPRIVTRARPARGMTLIEVLVTLVIISVGLLGVAALQLTTVRNNYDAFVRSQAAMLASDMLDRIRANRTAALASQYNVAFGEEPDMTTPVTTDLAQWKATLAAELPNGDGSIVTNAAQRVVTISISWSERNDPDDEQLIFTTSSQI